MRRQRQVRRGFGKRRVPARRALAGEDDPLFEERGFDIAVGGDEQRQATSDVET